MSRELKYPFAGGPLADPALRNMVRDCLLDEVERIAPPSELTDEEIDAIIKVSRAANREFRKQANSRHLRPLTRFTEVIDEALVKATNAHAEYRKHQIRSDLPPDQLNDLERKVRFYLETVYSLVTLVDRYLALTDEVWRGFVDALEACPTLHCHTPGSQ